MVGGVGAIGIWRVDVVAGVVSVCGVLVVELSVSALVSLVAVVGIVCVGVSDRVG